MKANCARCLIEFSKASGNQKFCHSCKRLAGLDRSAAWRKANIDGVRIHDRARIDPEKNRARARAWAKANPERAKAAAIAGYQANRAERIAKASAWNAANRDRRREISSQSAKRLRAEHPERFKEAKRKRSEVAGARVNDAVSAYIRICLRGRKAGASWEGIVGFTLAELMNHLEARFADGMTFDNYGEWHIDHIRPVASFQFESSADEQFKECWALSNLQPLWAVENVRKNSNWNGQRFLRNKTPRNESTNEARAANV
jgi:hypothetical protein